MYVRRELEELPLRLRHLEIELLNRVPVDLLRMVHVRIVVKWVSRRNEIRKLHTFLAVHQPDQQIQGQLVLIVPVIHRPGGEGALKHIMLVQIYPDFLLGCGDYLACCERRNDLLGVENLLVVVLVLEVGLDSHVPLQSLIFVGDQILHLEKHVS